MVFVGVFFCTFIDTFNDYRQKIPEYGFRLFFCAILVDELLFFRLVNAAFCRFDALTQFVSQRTFFVDRAH